MRDENERPLLSKPISEVTIDQIDQQYVARVKWYLEHELNCKMTPLGEQKGYLIQFPDHTTEEVYAGQSTQWRYRTTIRFPGGKILLKDVLAPLNGSQKSVTMFALPNSLLDGPEPPESSS